MVAITTTNTTMVDDTTELGKFSVFDCCLVFSLFSLLPFHCRLLLELFV